MDYPTEEELQKIREWQPDDFHGLMEYVRGLWKYSECGYWVYDKDDNIYNISTAGWSGNEEIVAAMEANHVWWMMYWQSSARGGHYTFTPLKIRSRE